MPRATGREDASAGKAQLKRRRSSAGREGELGGLGDLVVGGDLMIVTQWYTHGGSKDFIYRSRDITGRVEVEYA